MVKSRDESLQVFRKVLNFTLGHWARRKAVVGGTALAMTLYTLSEVIVPVFAGRLVDAMVQGRAAIDSVVTAFITMAALGLVSCPVNTGYMCCSQFGHNWNGRDRYGDGATESGVDLERG